MTNTHSIIRANLKSSLNTILVYNYKMPGVSETNFQPDSVVQAVLDKFIDRARIGKEKYGATLDREDLSVLDWIQHAQEEHMDAILYLEKLKRVYQQRESPQLPPAQGRS